MTPNGRGDTRIVLEIEKNLLGARTALLTENVELQMSAAYLDTAVWRFDRQRNGALSHPKPA